MTAAPPAGAPDVPEADDHLRRLPDGTVKQINPFTGTEVWTVPRPETGSKARSSPWQNGQVGSGKWT